jgi:hypothetical protein
MPIIIWKKGIKNLAQHKVVTNLQFIKTYSPEKRSMLERGVLVLFSHTNQGAHQPDAKM